MKVIHSFEGMNLVRHWWRYYLYFDGATYITPIKIQRRRRHLGWIYD